MSAETDLPICSGCAPRGPRAPARPSVSTLSRSSARVRLVAAFVFETARASEVDRNGKFGLVGSLHRIDLCSHAAGTVCPGLGKKIRRLIWPCSADDDAAARRLGWCCCWGAALRLAGRAAGPHACRARSGGSRVAGGCGKPVRRCGGGKSPATEGALSEDPHSGQVVRAERLGGRRRPAAGIRGRSGYPTDHRTGRAPPLSRRPGLRRVHPA